MPEGMFALASSSHLSSLSSSLLSSPSHSDVTLVTPSLSLQAHKSLLLSRLPALSSLLCPSCSPHDPLLLLLPDTPASSLTSALQQLYTTGQPEQLAGLLGLGQGVKGELGQNQNIPGIEKEGCNEVKDALLKQEEVFENDKINASVNLLAGEGEQLEYGSEPEFSCPMLEKEPNPIFPGKARKHILLDLGPRVKGELIENQDKKLEEKGLLEDDLDISYQDKDEGNHDIASFPCKVEGTIENYKKKSFPQSVRRKKGRNLNRPGSDQMLVDPV